MGATKGTTGFGTLFKVGDGASAETFSTVAEVKSISGPNLTLETVDATHMESPGGYAEFLPSFKSAGEVTLEVNFLPGDTEHRSVLTDFRNRTKKNFKLCFSDAETTEWSFSGYYTGVQPSASVSDMLSASITVKVSGDVTIS